MDTKKAMNLEYKEELKNQNFLKPEIIEPQHRCKRKLYEFTCDDVFDMNDISDIEVALNLKSTKVQEKSTSSCEENEINFLESAENSTLMKVDVNSVPNLDLNKSGDWNKNIVSCKLKENTQQEEIDKINSKELKFRNVYSYSNSHQPNVKPSNINFDLHLKKEGAENDQRSFIRNVHTYLVDYQESCGTPRTEYPFAALIQVMGQITGRCLLALLYMLISVSPIIQIFLYILRFVLDKVINIQETTDYYQMFIKYVILSVQLLSVFICLAFIFGFIILPIMQMGITIVAKILLYE